jgi:hypothetical protein
LGAEPICKLIPGSGRLNQLANDGVAQTAESSRTDIMVLVFISFLLVRAIFAIECPVFVAEPHPKKTRERKQGCPAFTILRFKLSE